MKAMRAILLVGFSLVSSCSLFSGRDAEPETSETQPRLVGRIALVPAEGDFVLIESYGPWRVPEAATLSAVGTDGRTSNLVVTGEKLDQHAAADLRSGVAKVGDAVYYRPLDGSPELPKSVDPPVEIPDPPKIQTPNSTTEGTVKP